MSAGREVELVGPHSIARASGEHSRVPYDFSAGLLELLGRACIRYQTEKTSNSDHTTVRRRGRPALFGRVLHLDACPAGMLFSAVVYVRETGYAALESGLVNSVSLYMWFLRTHTLWLI